MDTVLRHPAQAVLLCVDSPHHEAEWAELHFSRRQQSFNGQLLRCALAPEKNTFKIEQAREVLSLCATQPPPGQGLWVWFSASECFTPEAANALLKLLEEPWERQWFVLSTARPDAVLPTIRSRCVQLRTPHAVSVAQSKSEIEKLAQMTNHQRLALAETLAEDEAQGKVFLQTWLQHLRWRLHSEQNDPTHLLLHTDAILTVLSHWGRPIQKRLALESLLFFTKKAENY